jgi:hypothetical protein
MAYLIPRKYFDPPQPLPIVPAKASDQDWQEAKAAMGLKTSETPTTTAPPALPAIDNVLVMPKASTEKIFSPEQPVTPDVIKIIDVVKPLYLKQREKSVGVPKCWKPLTYKVDLAKETDYLVRILTNDEQNLEDHLRIFSMNVQRSTVSEWRANLPSNVVLDLWSKDAPPAYSPVPEVQGPPPSAAYITHRITANDTVQSLSLFYNVSQNSIVAANNLTGKNIQERSTVLIPIDPSKPLPKPPAASEEAERKAMVMTLVNALQQDGWQMEPTEARIYLETNDWDLEKAEADAKAGLEWEVHTKKPETSKPKKKKGFFSFN